VTAVFSVLFTSASPTVSVAAVPVSALVSMVTERPLDALLVLPAASVALAVMLCAPTLSVDTAML
jgi:hypothetical protein